MLKNYLIITFRNLNKNKVYSFFNILGLALGLCCFTLILSYVKHENSYEKCYPKSDRIYRITHLEKGSNSDRHSAITSPLFGPLLQEQIPEVELVCRFQGVDPEVLQIIDSDQGMKRFTIDQGFYVDSSMFKMFDIKLLEGSTTQVFSLLGSIIISKDLAFKMFGSENPIGNTIHFPTRGLDFIVTGIFENSPSNTHIQMNYCTSLEYELAELKKSKYYNYYINKNNKSVYTYILLNKKSTTKELEVKIPSFIQSYFAEYEEPEVIRSKYEYPFQPIQDIHLYSNLEREMNTNGSIKNVYTYSIVGFLILLIASINYINITTVLILKRNKELAVRRIIGASKAQITIQYCTESILFVFTAVVLSVLLVDIILPYFNLISGNELKIIELYSISNILTIIFIGVIVSIASAIYPIYVALNINLKGTILTFIKKGAYSYQFRRVLISFQFVTSVVLIFCTLVIYSQLKLFSNKDLGFDKEQLLQVTVSSHFIGTLLSSDEQSFKAELLMNPNIQSVSYCSNHPGDQLKSISLITNSENNYRKISVDADYLKTMKIKLLEGEDFKYVSDTTTQYMLTESGKQVAGYINPIGKTLHIKPWGKGKIVGIIQNFNFSSLHDKIDPLVLIYPEISISEKIVIRYQGNYTEVVAYIEEKVKEIDPISTLDISTVEQRLDSLYAIEFRIANTITGLTLIAIIISCIGLFGLSAFTAEVRLKEMGIRKIHGASVLNIAKVFSFDFIKTIIISAIVAIPVAWWVMDMWLQNFAYRIQISWLYAVYSILTILIVSLITIIYQIVKITEANPIEYLKYE